MTANIQERRLGPELITGPDRGRLEKLATAMNQDETPAFIGTGGESLEIPHAIYVVLRQIVNGMREGKAMLLIPETEEMTTQAAANYLGVSRPHLVELLEKGKIPYHMCGTHRRILFGDVARYGQQRDGERRAGMDELRRMIKDAGRYDPPDE